MRYCLLLLTTLPLVSLQPRLWRARCPWLQALRALGLVGSAVLFLQGLKLLPIAEATALVFASPIYITLLAALLLGERIGKLQGATVLLGFAGVLVIAQPDFTRLAPGALYPMSSSMAWAVAVVCTRLIGNRDAAGTCMLYSSVFGVAVLSLFNTGDDLSTMARHWPTLLAMAAFWCTGQWLVVLAYSRASPTFLAPFSYSQLLWASLLGWLLFDQIPSARTATGMTIIVLSGCLATWVARPAKNASNYLR